MLYITLLGTSALLPLPDRALTAVLAECNGDAILFDCGEGTQSAARKAEVSLMKTKLIAFTHYHGDHIFGLPGLLQTMNISGRTAPLYITGPVGLKAGIEPLLKLCGGLNFEVYLLDMPEEGLRLSEVFPGFYTGALLTPIMTRHKVKSCGYALTLPRPGKFNPEKALSLAIPKKAWSALQRGENVSADGRIYTPRDVLGEPRKGLKFVFSGDTAYCESLCSGAQTADLFICEATYGNSEQALLASEHGHMTFCEAALTAKNAEVKELWLAHFSQRMENPEDYLPFAAAVFPAVTVGRDGMKKELRFEERG